MSGNVFDETTHYERAKYLHSAHIYHDALVEINACLRINPREPRYQNYKGVLLYVIYGKGGNPLKYLSELVSPEDPEYSFFLRERAIIKINAYQDNEGARDDLQHLLAINPLDDKAQRILDELDDGITIPQAVPAP